MMQRYCWEFTHLDDDDGCAIYDRTLGHNMMIVFCWESDMAERIVTALNREEDECRLSTTRDR